MGIDPGWEEIAIAKGLTAPKDRTDLTLKIMSELATQTPSTVEALPGESVPKPRRKAVQHEAEFQQKVIELARTRGFMVAHCRRVRIQRKNGSVYYETPMAADGAGFPDLLFIRPRDFKALVAELKHGKNTTTPEQDKWLGLFAGALIPAFVWRESDWREIEEALK